MLACIPKMHADDLSNLISTIAGTNGIPKAVASSNVITTGSEVNASYFDEIAYIITENGAFDFILNSVTPSSSSQPSKNGFNGSYSRWSHGNIVVSNEFVRPVPGIVTSDYGWRSEFNRMHNGVDLRLNVGDTVRAAMSGTVKKIGYDKGGYGNYVVLTHPDGVETLYGHLQYALTFAGQFIQIGMPVGIGGNTGNSTGPHLHFEARLNGVAVNPSTLYNFGAATHEYNAEETEPVMKSNATSTLMMGHTLNSRSTYVVKQGDTPATIARRAGISVMRLCQLNMISEMEPLQIGRMLKLK